MTCEQARPLLHAYLDDELDLGNALELERHLAGCPRCQAELAAATKLRSAIAQPAHYFPAPAALRKRIAQSLRDETAASDDAPARRRWQINPLAWTGLAAAAVLLLAVGTMMMSSTAPSRINQVAIVDSHLRSLQADRLFDVESTDQHTVKPWFAGKLDFSPPVIDLAPAGFPLVGGRVDYVDGQKVAVLVYRRGKHVINLFVWPGEASSETDAKNGFNLVRFTCKGMTCWAISDVNAADLQQFAELFQSQKSPSTRS